MDILPSGLPDQISDEESLARFLTSSSQYNSTMVKPSALLPEPRARETSVFRHDAEPLDILWALGNKYAAQGRNIHGAAIIRACDVKSKQLHVRANEPPPRHAAITGWPWLENDPELQKAQQKDIANYLASNAILLLM